MGPPGKGPKTVNYKVAELEVMGGEVSRPKIITPWMARMKLNYCNFQANLYFQTTKIDILYNGNQRLFISKTKANMFCLTNVTYKLCWAIIANEMYLWCHGTVQLLMIYETILLSRLLRKVVSFSQGQINLPKVKSISRKIIEKQNWWQREYPEV